MYWMIKHIPTGDYFPLSVRGGKRGSTYIDLPFKGTPRIFTKSCSAKCALDWWLAGKAVTEYDSDGVFKYAVGASAGNGDPNRNAKDFKIVKVVIEEL